MKLREAILLTVASCIVCLGLSFYYSHDRLLWSDEILGWMLVPDPSWRHMLYAWRHGADGGGIVFYLMARDWLLAFGESTTAFRLFSAAGIWCGLVFTYLIVPDIFGGDRICSGISGPRAAVSCDGWG